jgi:drug/metabolite transporter (DMT)-like permease
VKLSFFATLETLLMKPQPIRTLSPASFALGAAILFGVSIPSAKVLLGTVDPVLLAGLLYLSLGSGLVLWWGLRLWWRGGNSQEVSIKGADLLWLIGAILTGGVVGPILLMVGLSSTPASSASLLLAKNYNSYLGTESTNMGPS